MTKVKPPQVQYRGTIPSGRSKPGDGSSTGRIPDPPRPTTSTGVESHGSLRDDHHVRITVRVRHGSNGRAVADDDSGRARADRRPIAPRPRRLAPFDDEWRRWIAENLMVGQPPREHPRGPDGQRVLAGGRRPARSTLAAAEPLPQGLGAVAQPAEEARLAAGRLSEAQPPASRSGEIERRHRLSRDEFLREYYSTNRPVIITGMMDDWPAMRKWNLDYFAEKFGDREVEVQMGRTPAPNYEIEREKLHRPDPIRRFRREGARRPARPTTST